MKGDLLAGWSPLSRSACRKRSESIKAALRL
jgi:hypothetical protein